MRLIARRKVDLPQPDGPMIAVTVFSGKLRSMPSTAWWRPKKQPTPTVCSGSRASATGGGGLEAPCVAAGVEVGGAGSEVIGTPATSRGPRSGGPRC